MKHVCTSGQGHKAVSSAILHVLPQAGCTLYVGTTCNDGRPITESWKYQEAMRLGLPIVRPKPIIQMDDDSIKEKKELLVDKYRPRNIKDIIGHKENIQQIGAWLEGWSTQEKKGLLITGPPGIGKTSTVHVIAAMLGYKVTEYNASDVRSVAKLKGILALGMRRLQKEVIVMDEVDGLSGQGERGGVGEIADLVRKTNVPFFCIANELPPKLKPLQNACLTMKFHRPVKSTIATAVREIAKKEGITVTKEQVEELCEKNGNDIRSILNALEFYQGGDVDGGLKDGILRHDLFSATQKLMAQKRLPLHEAEDLVYVDYSMIPLMVQEAYATASRPGPAGQLDELEAAAEQVSYGDTIQSLMWKTQDWSLLPLTVQNTIAVSRTVSGPAPFQIFPQLLGKMSKKTKHTRFIEDLARKERCSSAVMRLDKACALQTVLVTPLIKEGADVKVVIKVLNEKGWTRDDLLEHLPAVLSEPMEIPTKVKSALTREFNKQEAGGKKRKAAVAIEVLEDGMDVEESGEVDEVDEVEEQLFHLEI